MNLPELLKIAEAANDHPLLDKRVGRWLGEHEIANGICEESLNEFIRTFNPSVAIELIKRLQEAEKKAEDFRAIVVKAMEEEDASWTGDFKYPANLALCSALKRIDAAMNGGKE